jgi:ribokinase
LSLIDTTGAGDCFTGAFAVKMLEDATFEEALTFANQVGFLCITKFGAGPSVPYIKEIQHHFADSVKKN